MSCHGMRAVESSNKPRRPTLMIMSGALFSLSQLGPAHAKKTTNGRRRRESVGRGMAWHGRHAPPSNGLGTASAGGKGREGTPLLLLLLPTEFGCEDPKVWHTYHETRTILKRGISRLIQGQVYNFEHLGMSLFWVLPLSRCQWPMAVHFDPPSPPKEGATAIELCRVHSAAPLLGLGSFPPSLPM